MDIADHFQAYAHLPVAESSLFLRSAFSFAYNILGTLCCVGLFILVMAAIVFAAMLYRRRRSAQLLTMSAILQQQALDPSHEGEASVLADELLNYSEAGNPNISADDNFGNLASEEGSGTSDDEL